MSDVDLVVGYMLGSFGLGWCAGYLIQTFKKAMDMI